MLRTSLRGFSVLACLGAIGCASVGFQQPLSAIAIELDETPFHPQTKYMCGPSALATVFHRSGLEISSEKLAEQVYVPRRRGSLQIEMVAATRRHDRLAVLVDGNLQAILDELKLDRPVLVLQNLGLKRFPVWHYAVVIGYDPDDDSFILRSGTTKRLVIRRSRFARTWARAERWAIVVLKPGELPQSQDATTYVNAVVGLESTGRLHAAFRAYQAGLTRWPSNNLLLFGYGNTLYELEEIELAAKAYQDLLVVSPEYLPALNNLAQVLGELGCRREALALVDRASQPVDSSFRGILAETRRSISNRPDTECGVVINQRPGPFPPGHP